MKRVTLFLQMNNVCRDLIRVPMHNILLPGLLLFLIPVASSEIVFVSAGLEPVIARASVDTAIVAYGYNSGETQQNITVELSVPPGVEILSKPDFSDAPWKSTQSRELRWVVNAATETNGEVTIMLRNEARTIASTTFQARWTQPVVADNVTYVPEPVVADTGNITIGVFLCPLWKQGTLKRNWDAVFEYPERKPALGFYDEGEPEVTDWEIKWALENGITLFIPCWYRAKETLGKPVRPVLGHWLHDGLFESRYGNQIQFAILWENGNPVASGVASEEDLLENLLPFWIENYFSRPNYYRFDGKPVLFIYRPDVLIQELGGIHEAHQALDNLRAGMIDAGFDGIILLGEHHYNLDEQLTHLANLGLEYGFSYHWPTFSNLMPADTDNAMIMEAQRQSWQESEFGLGLPAPLTISMGWDSTPWGGVYSRAKWRLQPAQFKVLLEDAKKMIVEKKNDGLDRHLLLVDNWNEFAEGHYIFPHREHGFGYLEAIRSVFAKDSGKNLNIVPEDVGLGPYDSKTRAIYEAWLTSGSEE